MATWVFMLHTVLCASNAQEARARKFGFFSQTDAVASSEIHFHHILPAHFRSSMSGGAIVSVSARHLEYFVPIERFVQDWSGGRWFPAN
jgi:hypothetical protein